MRRLDFLVWGLVVLLVAGCGISHAQRGYKYQVKTLTSGGEQRGYSVYAPTPLKGKRPAIIMLHGGNGIGTKLHFLTFDGFEKLADREGLVIVYPQGEGKSWNDGRESDHISAQKADVDDVAFISKLIDTLIAKENVDPRRVYVGGISNGGMMANRLGCELSGKIAGIAVVAASMPGKIISTCHPKSPVSVIMFAGTKDPLVPYGGGSVTVLGSKRGLILGAPATARMWAKLNGFPSKKLPTVTAVPDNNPNDGMSVMKTEYKTKGDVVLYTIVNGGHTWPGGLQYAPEYTIGSTIRDFDAVSLIWDFFKSRPKK